MATKAEVQTLIDTNLATGTVITAIKHREVETAILNFSDVSTTSNRGFITIGDINSGRDVGFVYPVGGDVNSATLITRTARGEVINVVIANALPSLVYLVRMQVESLGSIEIDNDIHPLVFKIKTTNSFEIYVEDYGGTQNIRVYIETQAV
jgi:hypothetical protein